MGKAFTLPKNSKCGLCDAKIKERDIYTIIYEDDNSGNIKHLLCDNCEVDDTIQLYRDTGEVSSRLSMDAALANYHFTESNDPSLSGLRSDVRHYYKKYKKELLEIASGSNKIQEAIQQFEKKHWHPYLKKYWNDTNLRGHAADVEGLKVLMWGCAGRVLITVRQDKDDITMIFSDEKSDDLRAGQQGINAPHEVALAMIQKLTKVSKIKFKPDDEVKLAGL